MIITVMSGDGWPLMAVACAQCSATPVPLSIPLLLNGAFSHAQRVPRVRSAAVFIGAECAELSGTSRILQLPLTLGGLSLRLAVTDVAYVASCLDCYSMMRAAAK